MAKTNALQVFDKEAVKFVHASMLFDVGKHNSRPFQGAKRITAKRPKKGGKGVCVQGVVLIYECGQAGIRFEYPVLSSGKKRKKAKRRSCGCLAYCHFNSIIHGSKVAKTVQCCTDVARF